MKREKICKHCDRPESNHPNHCVFEPLEISDGCVCDPNTWDGEIAPICGGYQGDGRYRGWKRR